MNTALKIRAQQARVGNNLIVLRALPTAQLASVGPFVFVDHFGPLPSLHGGPSAHPHAGIEVLTWLFDGESEHRDSMGNVGRIRSGGAQWMKAGRGALHSETMLTSAPITHGVQLWTRQPIDRQEDAPEYAHFQAEDMPDWTEGAARLRLLAGTMCEQNGVLTLGLDSLALRVSLPAGASVDLPINPLHEIAVYGLSGTVRLLDDELARGELVRLADGSDRIELSNHTVDAVDLLVLGGEVAPQPLIFEGPFVFESRERIMQAKRDFVSGKMGQLDGVPF